ncbi:MAG: NAD(P)/FAD-dependent oxidoreductase [Flavobacteriales bacterium]|nr:NAD(P)/FAD-dependent oxidoreductase [Flavobacteriales bacterium]
MYEALAKEEIEGGVESLVSALEKAATANGVEIKTSTEVTEVVLENGEVKGVKTGESLIESAAVMSSCSTKRTMMDLISPAEISFDTETQVNNLRSRGTTAIVNLSLDQPVQFSCGNQDVSIYRTGSSFDEIEKAFDSSKYRQYSENPMLEIRVSEDRKNLNIMTHYAPHDLESGWTDAAKDGLLDNVKKELSLYIDGQLSITSSEIISPKDIEERWGIPGGHIFHAEHAIDQLITRPFPAFMQYRTGIPGLFHCGSSAHPGGGITCAPGYLAASAL